MGVAAAKPKETSDGDTPVLEVDNTASMEIADVDAVILKAAAATASAPMVQSNSPYSQVYKRIVDNYLSLPAPPVLPSGLPNVWSLRVNAVKLNDLRLPNLARQRACTGNLQAKLGTVVRGHAGGGILR